MRSNILKEKQSKVCFFLQSSANLHTKVAFIVRDSLFQIFYILLSKSYAITESNLSIKMPLTDIVYF